jgi:hypothetical protein
LLISNPFRSGMAEVGVSHYLCKDVGFLPNLGYIVSDRREKY